MSVPETITAIATPPGRGGVGIVRVSGPLVPQIMQTLLGKLLEPRQAHYTTFKEADGDVIDEGIALYFPNPHSFTGDDVLELQGHGGPVVMDTLLQRVLQLGARLAEPGEFSKQAFLNDKLDLSQAEAIADLIDCTSQQAAKLAVRSLQGAFSIHIHALVDALTQLRMYVEATLDFPEEDIEVTDKKRLEQGLKDIQQQLDRVFTQAKQGQVMREGMTVVIAGKPNAGKSSLLNYLVGRETAIVTHIPGTTRDVLRENIHIEGVPFHIVDTAGLRESPDTVEKEGIKRAIAAMHQADYLLLIVDGHEQQMDLAIPDEVLQHIPENLAKTVVVNKIDLTDKKPREEKDSLFISAKTGQGMDILQQHLLKLSGYNTQIEGAFMARRRHLEALEIAKNHVKHAKNQFSEHQALELFAEDLRLAQQALCEITGEFSSDDLLGVIFSKFCIGK